MRGVVPDRVLRRCVEEVETPIADESGRCVDDQSYGRALTEDMVDRKQLDTHAGRPSGDQRLCIPLLVGVQRAQLGRDARVFFAMRRAQPAALKIDLLTVRPDFGE